MGFWKNKARPWIKSEKPSTPDPQVEASWQAASVETPSLSLDRAWTTADELAFIRGLGRHRQSLRYDEGRPRVVEARMVLLRKYLASCAIREEWGGVDYAACIVLARQLLDDELSIAESGSKALH